MLVTWADEPATIAFQEPDCSQSQASNVHLTHLALEGQLAYAASLMVVPDHDLQCM